MKGDESLMEKISEKLQGQDSSSLDSNKDDTSSSFKSKVFRDKPLHHVFGGAKSADVVLWREKKVSAGVLGGATAIWFLFQVLEYNLLTLLCHVLILSLAVLFLWSNAANFIHKSPPRIPELSIPEKPVLQLAEALTVEINRGSAVIKEIAIGRDLNKFIFVVVGLWILSVLGSCFDFLTLFYIVFVSLLTIPVLYEKYEDKVDPFADKAMIEIKKQYAVFDAKVLSKIPRGLLKDNKKD